MYDFKAYSRGERIADAAVHVAGIAACAVAVPILIVMAAWWHGASGVLAAAAIYGASLMAMLGMSAAYNMVQRPKLKSVLRRFDHGAIYVKIAGTYTPFAVLAGGSAKVLVLTTIWTAALAGLVLVITSPRGFRWMALTLYLAMGWAVVLLGQPMLDAMTAPGFWLVVTGGLLYTLGVVFHLWDRLPYQNAIWHGHVLVASMAFYAAVLMEIGHGAT
ncbi:MAG: hemolysin III family protein [Pseudomonadota bacterium]